MPLFASTSPDDCERLHVAPRRDALRRHGRHRDQPDAGGRQDALQIGELLLCEAGGVFRVAGMQGRQLGRVGRREHPRRDRLEAVGRVQLVGGLRQLQPPQPPPPSPPPPEPESPPSEGLISAANAA